MDRSLPDRWGGPAESVDASGARRGDPVRERYVVVAYDPQTDELDCFGPYPLAVADVELRRRRTNFDDGDLGDVELFVVLLVDG